MRTPTLVLRPARLLMVAALVSVGCASQPDAPAADDGGFLSRARGRQAARDAAAERARSEAPDTLGDRATLPDLARATLDRNPRIAAARARWGAAVAGITLARSLPDPQVMYAHFIENVETRVGPQEQRAGVRQMLPFPWKLKLAADSASEGARIAGLEYEIAVRDVLVALKDAYFEHWYLHRARRIATGHLSLLEQLLATARNEQARGVVTLTDVLRLESQKAQLEYDLLTLIELARVTRAKMNAMLDRSTDAPLGIPGELAPPVAVTHEIEQLIALGREHRQEILRARTALDKAGIDVSRAKWARVPNFSIGGSWIGVGPSKMPNPDSGKDASMIEFGIEIPLWGSKNRARIEKAEQHAHAARDGVRAAERALEPQVQQVAFRLRNARRLVELYGNTLLPQAEQAARIAREWYEGGQGGFMHLVEVQSVLYNYHLALDRARADYHQTLNRLEGLLGVSLRGQAR